MNKRYTIYSDNRYHRGMLNLTYEYKLIPTDAQRETFDHWLEICRKCDFTHNLSRTDTLWMKPELGQLMLKNY